MNAKSILLFICLLIVPAASAQNIPDSYVIDVQNCVEHDGFVTADGGACGALGDCNGVFSDFCGWSATSWEYYCSSATQIKLHRFSCSDKCAPDTFAEFLRENPAYDPNDGSWGKSAGGCYVNGVLPGHEQPVPEFSGLAFGVALAGAGFVYLKLRSTQ